jgi:hypothetical protein
MAPFKLACIQVGGDAQASGDFVKTTISALETGAQIVKEVRRVLTVQACVDDYWGRSTNPRSSSHDSPAQKSSMCDALYLKHLF